MIIMRFEEQEVADAFFLEYNRRPVRVQAAGMVTCEHAM
jgi:hypothetical protein